MAIGLKRLKSAGERTGGGVECDARGAPERWAYGQFPEFWSEPDPDPLGRMPSIRAVTFLGLIDGKMACRPATDEEQRGSRGG